MKNLWWNSLFTLSETESKSNLLKVRSHCSGNDKINMLSWMGSIPIHDSKGNGKNGYHGIEWWCLHCSSDGNGKNWVFLVLSVAVAAAVWTNHNRKVLGNDILQGKSNIAFAFSFTFARCERTLKRDVYVTQKLGKLKRTWCLCSCIQRCVCIHTDEGSVVCIVEECIALSKRNTRCLIRL